MILSGDCLSKIDEIDSSSIQTVVTSPPYWGLRNYDNDEFAVKVDYGQSFLYPGSAADGVSGSMDAIHSGGTAVLAQDSMNDLKRIIAHATGSNVDLEIFTAST